MAFWNFPAYLGAIGYKLTEKLLAQEKVFIAEGKKEVRRRSRDRDFTDAIGYKTLVIVAKELTSNKIQGFSHSEHPARLVLLLFIGAMNTLFLEVRSWNFTALQGICCTNL